MTSESMFAFALALVVALSAVVAWLTSSMTVKAAEQRLSTIANALSVRAATITRAAENVRTKLAELEHHSPKKLLAEVAALNAAVESLNDTHRRFAGRVWQRIGPGKNRDDEPVARVGNGIANDDELQALLDLQTAPPASPGE